MIRLVSLAGQVKLRGLCVVLSALLLFVLVLSAPSLGQEQTGVGFGLDSPQELDARIAMGGTPSTGSETEALRGRADSRVRSYALRLFADSLREAGESRFGENFSLDSALTWSQGTSVRGQLSAVVPLGQGLAQGQDRQGNFLWGSFLQPSLNLWTDDLQKSRRDLSLGYVARRRVAGYGTVGGSLFLDRGDYGHQRASLGAEWRGGANFFSAQLHQPLTGAIRTPSGRYEGVLAGWSAVVRRSVRSRLDLGLESTTWRDSNGLEGKLSEGKTIGEAVALGTTHKATVGYRASPALRLYGGYSRNRLAQGVRNDGYELGFEYRLIGERQKLSAAGDEGEGKIYSLVRNRPLLAMGVYGLAAFALTDLDEDKKSTPAETCATGGVSCPQADAVVWIVDAAGQDLARGSVARPASSGDADKVIKVRVKLVSVAKPTVYRVSLIGTAVAGTEYDLQSLAVQQGAGAFVAQAGTEYFRVPAGGETTLEMTFAIKHLANAAISEIGVRLVPVEASAIAATQSIGTLSSDTETGEITAWVRLAGSGSNAGTITPAGTVNPMAGLITIQLLTAGARNVSRSISGNIHSGVFGGAGATAPLRIFVENFGQAPAGGRAKTSNFINFPAQVAAFKAYLRLAHSNGANEDSYTITGAGVRKVAAGVWEVPMVRSGRAFQGNLRFTKQTVTTNGQQVVATVEVPPIEYIKGDGTSERIPTFSSSFFSRVTITLNQ